MKPARVITSMTAAMLMAASVAMAAPDAAATYKSKCASCHAADGSGNTTMGKKMGLKDLRSPEVQKLSDDQLYKITADGQKKMPAYKGKIADADIKALVTYMRAMK